MLEIVLRKGMLKYFVFPLYLNAQTATSIHSLSAKDIEGTTVSFSDFKGKKLLIVNTASRCGFTRQYKQLQALYNTYHEKGLVIIGFPSNNFANQEPDSNKDIKAFCTKNYGVSFLMMEKIDVTGSSMHPVYKWLTQKSENGVLSCKVGWNFQKFMIDESGQIVGVVSPIRSPNCRKIRRWLNKS